MKLDGVRCGRFTHGASRRWDSLIEKKRLHSSFQQHESFSSVAEDLECWASAGSPETGREALMEPLHGLSCSRSVPRSSEHSRNAARS